MKLIKLLKALNSVELNEIGRFLNTTVFNRDKASTSLFGYLKKIHPDFPKELMEKKQLFFAAFPDKINFEQRTINDKISDLSLLIEKYLVWKEIQQQPVDAGVILAKALKRKNQDALFFSQLDKTKRLLEKNPYRDLWYYQQHFAIAYQEYFHPTSDKFKRVEPRLKLEETSQYLDTFFVLSKLRLIGESKTRSIILKEKDVFLFQKEVIAHINLLKQGKDNPLLKIYLGILTLYENNDNRLFDELTQQFLQHYKLCTPESLAAIATFLINYSALRVIEGIPEFKIKSYHLYSKMLKINALDSEGFLPIYHFKNICILGAELGFIKETEKFIKKWKDKLPETQQEATVRISEAHLKFCNQQYTLASNLLSKFQAVSDYTDYGDELRYRSLKLRCFYELYTTQHTDQVRSFCVAYINFLDRNKRIGSDSVQSNKSFIKVSRKLFRLKVKEKISDKDLKNLETEVLQAKRIICKDWLLKKINELKQ